MFCTLDTCELLPRSITGMRIPMRDSRMATSKLGVRSVGEIRGIGIRREVNKAFSWVTRIGISRVEFRRVEMWVWSILARKRLGDSLQWAPSNWPDLRFYLSIR